MKNNKMKWLAIEFILLVFCLGNLVAQDIILETENAYGPDPLLYNGKKYSFFVPSGTKGNQYFSGESFSQGMVIIKGVTFECGELNYDIYNQEILLRYPNETGALNLIALSQSWLECFSLGELRFELITLPDQPERIYQVLRSGDLGILFHRYKKLKLDMAYGSDKYVFSPPVRESYLQIGDEFVAFKNNRTFVAAFKPDIQEEIKKHMKLHHIKVKKASDLSLTELLNFTGGLMK